MIIGYDESNGEDYSAMVLVESGEVVSIVVGDTAEKATLIKAVCEAKEPT